MNFLDWHEFEGSNPEKFYKTTLWQGEHGMVGLNCLEPGQVQKVHAHAGAALTRCLYEEVPSPRLDLGEARIDQLLDACGIERRLH